MAVAKQISSHVFGVLTKLRRPDSTTLKALGSEFGETCRLALDKAPELVGAAHCTQGRRALSALAEANEELARAALERRQAASSHS